jgi:hypothetical protein
VHAISTNRYGGLFAMLQRVHPIPPVTAADLDDQMLQAFVGKAECLLNNPQFAPYRSDYLSRAEPAIVPPAASQHHARKVELSDPGDAAGHRSPSARQNAIGDAGTLGAHQSL